MSRAVQIYNPVHGQRMTPGRLNVMGRTFDKKIANVAVYLDRKLIRRVRVSQNGAFECRLDTSGQPLGKHEVEVRVMLGHRTERLVAPIYLVEHEEDRFGQGEPKPESENG